MRQLKENYVEIDLQPHFEEPDRILERAGDKSAEHGFSYDGDVMDALISNLDVFEENFTGFGPHEIRLIREKLTLYRDVIGTNIKDHPIQKHLIDKFGDVKVDGTDGPTQKKLIDAFVDTYIVDRVEMFPQPRPAEHAGKFTADDINTHASSKQTKFADFKQKLKNAGFKDVDTIINEATVDQVPIDLTVDFVKDLVRDGKELLETDPVGEGHDYGSNNIDNVNEKIRELDKEVVKNKDVSTLKRLGDFIKALLMLGSILGSIFGYWILFNLIQTAFSGCYWYPVSKKCKIDSKHKKDWEKMLYKAYGHIENEKISPSLMERIKTLDQSDLIAEAKAMCKCSESSDGLIPVVEDHKSNEGYGILKPFDEQLGQSVTRCGNDNTTVGCSSEFTEYQTEHLAGWPLCLNKNTDGEVIYRGEDDKKVNNDPESAVMCRGKYEYTNFGLNEMVNGIGDFANKLGLMLDPGNLLGVLVKVLITIAFVVVGYMILKRIIGGKSK
mgnify:FL=1